MTVDIVAKLGQGLILGVCVYSIVKGIRQSYLCRSAFYIANGLLWLVIPLSLVATQLTPSLLVKFREQMGISSWAPIWLGLLQILGSYLAMLGLFRIYGSLTKNNKEKLDKKSVFLLSVGSILFVAGALLDRPIMQRWTRTGLLGFLLIVMWEIELLNSLTFWTKTPGHNRSVKLALLFSKGAILVVTLLYFVSILSFLGQLFAKQSYAPFIILGTFGLYKSIQKRAEVFFNTLALGTIGVIVAVTSGYWLIVFAVVLATVGAYWRIVYLENHSQEWMWWEIQMEKASQADKLIFYRGFERAECEYP